MDATPTRANLPLARALAWASIPLALLAAPLGIVGGHLALRLTRGQPGDSARTVARIALIIGYCTLFVIIVGGAIVLYFAYVPSPEDPL